MPIWCEIYHFRPKDMPIFGSDTKPDFRKKSKAQKHKLMQCYALDFPENALDDGPVINVFPAFADKIEKVLLVFYILEYCFGLCIVQ